MNRLIATAVAISFTAVAAHAQTTPAPAPTMPAPAATTAPTTPAMPAPGAPVSTTTAPMKTPDAGAPLAGANSFTEAQAVARIVELGYADVKGLTKDTSGVWRGMAMKDGKSQNVALDFKGNIVVGQN